MCTFTPKPTYTQRALYTPDTLISPSTICIHSPHTVLSISCPDKYTYYHVCIYTLFSYQKPYIYTPSTICIHSPHNELSISCPDTYTYYHVCIYPLFSCQKPYVYTPDTCNTPNTTHFIPCVYIHPTMYIDTHLTSSHPVCTMEYSQEIYVHAKSPIHT